MAEIKEQFIQVKTKANFVTKLTNGEIKDSSIAFIEDSSEIWAKGKYYPCPYTKEFLDNKFTTEVSLPLATKVDKVEGKLLSTNDYTNDDKSKVAESINESAANTLINTAIGKLTKASVGLGNVDNTADANKEVLSATKLKTARILWGQRFDGTTNISGNITGIGSGAAAKLNIESVPTLVDYIHIYLPEARRPLVLLKDHGNVGIGVEAPVEKFEVDGNIKLTGSIKNVTEVYTTDGSKYVEPCTSDDIKALFT